MTRHPKRAPARRQPRGQALVELLILLPVLLILLLATAEIARLFAMSGKAEVSARYLTLRHLRNVPFLPTAANSYIHAIGDDQRIQARRIFFEGALGPLDAEVEQIAHEGFAYSPPVEGNPLWEIIKALDNRTFGIEAHRVTFLPFSEDTRPGWVEPLGELSAVGDFVVLTDTFSNEDGFDLLDWLGVAVLFQPAQLIGVFEFTLLVLLIISLV